MAKKKPTGKRNTGATSPKAVAFRNRQAQAVELRNAGKSFPEIAAAIGVTRSTAWKYVQAVLSDLQEKMLDDTKRAIASDLAILEAMRDSWVLDAMECKDIEQRQIANHWVIVTTNQRQKLIELVTPKRVETASTVQQELSSTVMLASFARQEVLNDPQYLEFCRDRLGNGNGDPGNVRGVVKQRTLEASQAPRLPGPCGYGDSADSGPTPGEHAPETREE